MSMSSASTVLEEKRGTKTILSGDQAVAEAAKMANIDVVSAYPITPQTIIVETLEHMIANGELKAKFIPVESEHSAMSAAVGASAAGARVFTSTASQGLALMHEIVYIASSLRLPIVMAVANRALSGPINIWNDLSDAMAERESGWIQLFAETVQEAFDTTLEAFRIAEDPRVSLPVMVGLDGYILSHEYEPITLPFQEDVDKYLPPRQPTVVLDPAKPVSMGTLAPPDYYFEIKYRQEKAIENSLPIIDEKDKEFAAHFGRSYSMLDKYNTDDADYVLVTMGSVSGTAKEEADRLRAQGMKVGVLRVRLFRPFPKQQLVDALSGVKGIGVLDRSMPMGSSGGALYQDVVASLAQARQLPTSVVDFISGIGGRDIKLSDFEQMFQEIKTAVDGNIPYRVSYPALRG